MVEFLPLRTCHCLGRVTYDGGHEGYVEEDGDSLNVLRFGGSERSADPLDARRARSELHIFELWGVGEVKRR